ncbi:MAG: glycosyltransferase [Halioglobus sp.]
MKVLIYTQYWTKGGIEKLIKYLVDGLNSSSEHFEIVILTEDVPDPAEQYVLPDSASVYFRNFTPFNEQNREVLRTLALKINPDVVVAMGSTRALYKMPRALVGLPYPIVLSEHNTNTEIVRTFGNDYRFYNAVRNLADINHVIFAEFAADFAQTTKIRAVPNPIVQRKERADVSEKSTNTIVHIGRYHLHQKQQDVLIRSFALVAEDYPTWQLSLYGGDWRNGRETLDKLITQHGLEDRIKLNDSIDNVAEVLSDSSFLAFPSSYEGFGLVVGEALSVGLPVLAFEQCDGVNQLVKDGINGVLVSGSVKDISAFAGGLRSLMGSHSARMNMAKNAPSSVSEFSLERFISGWREILKESYLLKGKNTLMDCSPMEIDYIDLVASGLLFDQNRRNAQAARKVEKIKRLFSRLGLEPLSKRLSSKL